MNMYDLLPGDRLLIKKGIVIHSGTYMGNKMVAHISPSKHLRLEPLEAFADRQSPRVICNGGIEEKRLWEGLKQFERDTCYSVLSNNCEDLCNFLEKDIKESPQRRGATYGMITGCVVVKTLDIRNPYAALSLIAGSTLLGIVFNRPKAISQAKPEYLAIA